MEQHIRLLALGFSYANKAKELATELYAEPHKLAHYQRSCYLSILSYRASLEIQGLSPQQELNSRLGLGRALYDFTSDISDAEHVVSRGLSKASEDNSLDDYLFRFYELHINISASKNVKFAQSLLKRATKDAERKKRKEWIYHFNFLAAKYSTNPLNFLRTIVDLAKKNHDTSLHHLGLAEVARILANNSDWKGCGIVLKDLEMEINLLPDSNKPANEEAPDKMDEDIKQSSSTNERGLREYILVVFLVVKVIFSSHNADANTAKKRLEEVQHLIDETQDERYFEMSVNGCSDKVVYQAPTKSQLLDFSFVLSCMTCKDPVGTKPLSLLYSLKAIDLFNEDRREVYRYSTIQNIEKRNVQRVHMKLYILCSLTQVYIMRREMENAYKTLTEMVKLSREHSLTMKWAAWMLMLEGYYLQASNELEAAKVYYESVISLCGKKGDTFSNLFLTNKNSVQNLHNDEMEVAAKLSKLALEVGTNNAEHDRMKELNESSKLIQCSSSILAALRMVEGMLNKSIITRSKYLLSQSLTLSSKSNDNHIRAFLFALLSEAFNHSHEDQALKMIETGYALARKMGKVDQASSKSYGMPFLNLFYGKCIADHYKRNGMQSELNKQESLNQFYTKCCNRIASNGFDKSIEMK
ncbi:hypothetical protein E3Q23_03093 [Wallemia mellicola]|uniref:TPR-like protein n=1 Tax=Wallemia mellicola TaxID=1708541 RepID=A0A4T0NKT3_9BASI|nr:hypothetical protein E3Q23_03093 [Wallemia mellicola]TIB97744.1 hypothetical protein E3Q17_03271 [Wallemia mellicola]TIC05180.1 hypothetical protein E3Q16_02376 [Wallemia mellicola]TIC43928.1 hypothetical protein E3Q08_02081 [Wallemia mellicola]TIC51816.1 hypothetical protein E3Q05_02987 [Wallemia mellicola]